MFFILRLASCALALFAASRAYAQASAPCTAAVVTGKACVIVGSPFTTTPPPTTPPACQSGVTISPQATSALQNMFAIAPAQIKQQLCSLGQLYLMTDGTSPSWGQHWTNTAGTSLAYMGVQQGPLTSGTTLVAMENQQAAAFWGPNASNLFASAAVGTSNTNPGVEWMLLAEVAHEIGHWQGPWSRSGTTQCPASNPPNVCALDPTSYFSPSWSYYQPLPPTWAFAETHPWGIAVRPMVMAVRSLLQAKTSPGLVYLTLMAACSNSASTSLAGEFVSWFALTAPTEDFAEGFTYMTLWNAGLSNLVVTTGSQQSVDVMQSVFNPSGKASADGSCLTFAKKKAMLEVYWQAMPQ